MGTGKYFQHKGISWHFEEFGSGSDVLLAFHGYGRDASDFSRFEPVLEQRYRIFSFDLPFHGRTRCPDGYVMRPGGPEEMVAAFLEEKGFHRFSVMGYSLGGKLALWLAQRMAGSVDEVFLFTPDGMRTVFWSRLVTHSAAGNRIYRYMIGRPAILFLLARVLGFLGLLSRAARRFVKLHTETREQRQRVLDVWTAFRNIEPDLSLIGQAAQAHGMKLHLFFGRHDRIIPPGLGRRLQRKAGDLCRIHVLDCGHDMVNEHTAEVLKDIVRG